ncbi:hypothetical protein [Colwellia psychrerythraea]|uniref:Lipoprotein n=1 Tax=Colwellia psychrerythraea TaxID=28229 RepID=A0A099L577_COLPS|nr:hypothetical protein [Colwellia psychrerythraea]KGJ97570.1 hypothetical protein GAB14E_1159 [Colwellia psychrerythraea]
MTTLQILQTLKSCLAASILLFILLGCNSSDDGSGSGYVKLYNLSKDSPSIYLTVDENLTEDNDDDDHFEQTYSGIAYGNANSNISLTSKNYYYYQLAWQDDDSLATDDLAVIYEDTLALAEDTIHMIVLSDSILSPQVTVHSFPVIDDEDDTSNDLFNIRVLNMHENQQAVDFYLSKENESFNEAILVGQFEYQQLSDNQKLDQDDYIFYITIAGSNEVLFRSNSIPFAYSSQNIMVVKENTGAGSSPYVLDKMSDSTVIEYVDAEAEAQFRAYNAVANHEQLNNYQEAFALHINGVGESPAITFLPYGEISNSLILASGDYSLDLTNTEDNTALLSNHLLSLVENTNKTLFFYAEQEYVDSDNDGNIDENGDGIIDEIDVNLFSLMVENSLLTSIYEHEIEIVNLIQSDDFIQVKVYFVRQDETINSAMYYSDISYKNTSSLLLKNNSYQVFVVAQDNGSSIILNTFELVLDEQSSEQFLVLESSNTSATGYKTTMFNQTPQQEEVSE